MSAFRDRFGAFAGVDGSPEGLCARDHVDRLLVVLVFIRRRLPTKTRRVRCAHLVDHGEAGENRFERLTIEDVNLAAATGDARVFLEGGFEYHGPEERTGQATFVQSLRKLLRVDP